MAEVRQKETQMNVDKIVKRAVKEIVEAYRTHQVPGAAAAYHAQADVKAFKLHIRDGLIAAGIPLLFVDRIIRK